MFFALYIYTGASVLGVELG